MRFPLHTAATITLLGVALAGARMITPESLGRWIGLPHKAPTPRAPAPEPFVKEGPPPLLDDRNHVLDRFYQSLRATEARKPDAVTRILHYGDSPTTADLITGDVRTILQARFGNAGHGFILPAKPWAWYQHTGARSEGKGWQIHAASQSGKSDGLFGLGGVSLVGSATASSKFKFDGDGYTHFELWFEAQAEGGDITLTAGDETARIETSGDPDPGFATFDTNAPAKTIDLTVTRGHVRIFGLTAEREAPGVVYDTLGLNGASVTVLSHVFNQAHWAAELQHRNPDLVIVNYGTNEADYGDFIRKGYERELREALRRLRAALPGASILVMSPMDRGYKNDAGEIATMETIPEIVAIQRRVAKDMGCGFFDTFHAMGGEGTIAKWYTEKPRIVSADYIHPYPAGGKIVAEAFTRELLAAYERAQTARKRKSAPPPEPRPSGSGGTSQ